MPQTNYTPILIYASGTTGNTPAAGNLTNSSGGSELAINYFDGRLFYKDASNVVRVLASRGTGTIGGSNNQVQYNSGGVLAGSANLTFDGNNLGVGTSSPAGKLDTRGTGYIGSDSNNALFVDSTSTLVTIGAAGRTSFSTSALRFLTSDGTASLERMRLDSSGNLGLGVTPSAWGSGRRAIQISGPSVSSLSLSNTIGETLFNSFVGAGGYVYVNTGVAGLFDFNNGAAGGFSWRVATSGTAGASVSFTQSMTLNASSQLLVGTTTNTNSSTVTAGGTISETVSSVQYLVASQFDVGTAPNKIPLNQYLGNLAYQNASAIAGRVGLSAGTAALPSIGSATDAATGEWFPATSVMAWSTAGVERMRLDSSGNLGLGITPSAWADGKAFQIGIGSLSYDDTEISSVIANNAYRSAANTYRYNAAAQAARYSVGLGTHSWFIAPSGSIGNVISFTQAMTLNSSGNLGVGTTSPLDKVSILTTQGVNTFANPLMTYGASISWPAGFANIYDANYVDQFVLLNARMTGGTRAAPTFTAASPLLGGIALRTSGEFGGLVVQTIPQGTNVSGTERLRVTPAGNQVLFQPAESAQNTSVTLTVANLQTRIITSNAAVTLTLPTGTSLEGYTSGMATDTAFECTFIATTANAITIAANGNTTVGSLTVAGNTSGTFRFRKTAANTFTVYRVA